MNDPKTVGARMPILAGSQKKIILPRICCAAFQTNRLAKTPCVREYIREVIYDYSGEPSEDYGDE
jgi:hypothetical protein